MISAWAITFIRAAITALAVAYLSKKLNANIAFLKGRLKVLALSLLLIPLIVPPLVPAYAFSAFSFNFQTKPFPNEILYFLIMISRLLPVGILILMILPSSMSKSSIFCDQLLKKNMIRKFQSLSHLLICCLCVFLLAFNEYEIASLMRIKHWTVTLFNAHAGGLVMNLNRSFQMALFPAVTSLSAIFLILKLLKNIKQSSFSESKKPGTLFFVITAISCLIGWIIPFIIILSNSFNGFQDAVSGSWMKAEYFNSLLISSISTGCCLAVIAALFRSSGKLVLLFVIPGLFGALLLGLSFIYIFNSSLLSSVKQSVLPLSLALILYGFPIAILMIIFFHKKNSAQDSTTTLLPASSRIEINWQNTYIPAILLSLPVFCYIWFDLTLSSMLAPASFTTVFPRIYNLMHYSENERLSATVLLSSALPLMLYIILFSLSWLIIKSCASRAIK